MLTFKTTKKGLAHASPKRHFSLTCARQPTLCQNIISKTSQLLMHLLYHKRAWLPILLTSTKLKKELSS